MAIAKGRKNEESLFKRFIGVGNFNVLGVNPDKDTLNSWGIMTENEPEYNGTQEEQDGSETAYARVSFYVKSVKFPDFITSISFFIKERRNYNKDKTKMEVIDIYGNTAWLTADEVKSKRVPDGMSADFRPAYPGEGDLTNFIRNFLDIPGSKNFNEADRTWTLREGDLTQSECTLDCIKDYFNGDFSELTEIVKYQPENQVKLLCGIRSSQDGKLRQDVSARYTARAFDNTAAARWQKKVNEEHTAGRLQNTEYDFNALHEWTLKTASQEEVEETISASSSFDDEDDELPFN